MTEAPRDLPIIQKAYDLILWYVPRLNKFPRDTKFTLGDRIQSTLYGLLEGLIRARYRRDRTAILESLNAELDVLRYQTRLCKDMDLFDARRFEYVSGLINELGRGLGGWVKHSRMKPEVGADGR